jgi:CubicO group peptidase (beta-lactamase class C family)
MQMLLNGGTYNGVRLLAPATVRLMTTNQIGDKSIELGKKFGLGFELVTEESKWATPLSVGSFSWGGMFSSSYWIDPKEKIVAQLFLNLYPNGHGDVHEKFKTMVYAALE